MYSYAGGGALKCLVQFFCSDSPACADSLG